MTPLVSTAVTAEQIRKLQKLLSARLREFGFPSETKLVQWALETQGSAIADEMVAALSKRVWAMKRVIVRSVRVNRLRTPQKALDATGHQQYATNPAVVALMPQGEGEEEIDVYFFYSSFVSDAEVEKEYALCGLVPADPYSLAAVNEDDPSFVVDHPNVTHWKDTSGKWYSAAFYEWDGERRVSVNYLGPDPHRNWWCAGLRE
ncbi:MAG: hypothetical protein WEC84_02360 [Candidatus Andersenbacteria bacterium]